MLDTVKKITVNGTVICMRGPGTLMLCPDGRQSCHRGIAWVVKTEILAFLCSAALLTASCGCGEESRPVE